MTEPLVSIEDADFLFENSSVRVVAVRECPEIELVGLKVGPFNEGHEYEVKFWTAQELEKKGIVRFREEELLDAVRLYKMHWKERVQSVKQISSLSEDFYPMLRRYLSSLKRQAVKKPEKIKEYQKVMQLSQDIANCRLKKIVSLASAPAQTDQTLNNLTREEHAVYSNLRGIISDWRSKILEGVDEP